MSAGAFERRPSPPWARPAGLSGVLQTWRSDPRVAAQLVLDHRQPGRAARLAPVPEGLHDGVRTALAGRGLTALYTHQVEAFERARAGEDLVVATPTASGKSLCYNLPVLDALCRAPDARALYLFPTKALSRDQEESLRAFMAESGLAQGAITYDGDTPGDARRAARDRAGLLVTNPDMLHTGVLPHHARWARFFANLRFVVVDEVHAYRGVFGSHLANVLRRLDRVARFHGARPQFLFSSATISNPGAHAARLAGRTVGVVDESGAPTSDREVLIYNPPLVNAELGMRRSYVKCAVDRTVELLRAGVSTLVFGQSRNGVEVMLKYLRDRIPESEIPAERIQAYRGGYLPHTRRRIERGLRAGEIGCVVATNALELGIDIGSLDAVVCAGYPGTMAALWQRFGRGGRRGRTSLAMLIPSSTPLDQFLAHHPQAVLDAPIEEARVDADNVEILVQHVKCAAFELQFRRPGDDFGALPAEVLDDVLEYLEGHRVVRSVPARGGGTTYHWSADAHPAHGVSLRAPNYDNFVIIDVASDKTIAEMDFRSTHTMLHEQAIYQHEGAQFQVERLDYENHKAFVRRVAPDYYTTAMTRVRVSVLEEEASARLGHRARVGAGWGDVDVVEKVVGYKKIKFHTHENVGYGEVNLPAVEKATTALWLTVPESVVGALGVPRSVVMDALRGWLVALEGVAAVGLMMDPRDLGTAFVDEPGVGAAPLPPRIGSPDAVETLEPGASSLTLADGLAAGGIASDLQLRPPEVSLPPAPVHRVGDLVGGPDETAAAFEPTLYLYDAVAGGTGLAPRLWEERENLVARSAGLVRACPCEEGCPSCVGPVVGTSDGFSRKAVVLQVLAVLGYEGQT